MRLIPVPAAKLDCLLSIFREMHSEYGVAGKSSPEHTLATLKSMYGPALYSAYVDNLEKPQHCVIMTHSISIFFPLITAYVTLIFSVKEKRGDTEAVAGMKNLIDSYASLNGAARICGSSWTLKGHKGIDSLWKAWGYEKQETVYTKFLE